MGVIRGSSWGISGPFASKDPRILGAQAADSQRLQRLDVGRLLLAALLVFVMLIGGNEIGRLASPVRAIAACVGAICILAYIRRLPRKHDLLDRLVLLALLLFLISCVTSIAPRDSFTAATTALGYAAAFYLARDATRTNNGRRMATTVLGVVGAVLSVAFLVSWLRIWMTWSLSLGGGIPPLDLALPGALFRHQYLAASTVAMTIPAMVHMSRRKWIWPLGLAGSLAGVAVVIISGGRGLWLAGICATMAGTIAAGHVRLRKGSKLRLVLIGAASVGLVVLAGPLLARLATTSTIGARLSIWHHGVDLWMRSPILGYGPGTFAREFQLSGYSDVPHAHNAAVQALVESGVLGGVALGVLCIPVLRGIWQSRKSDWAPLVAITFFAVACLTDNLSINAFLIAPLIAWSAIGCPRTPDAGRPVRSNPMQFASLWAAAVVAIGVVATIIGALKYDMAAAAARNGESKQAVIVALEGAASVDPAFALYHRDLGVWLQSSGDLREAINELKVAISLNPADLQARRAAAVAFTASHDGRSAVNEAMLSIRINPMDVQNALTLAFVERQQGNVAGESTALVKAIRLAPWITAADEWSDVYPDADLPLLFREAFDSWSGDAAKSVTNVQARSWLAGIVGAPVPPDATLADDVQAKMLSCDVAGAKRGLSAMSPTEATERDSLVARIMFERAFERGTERTLGLIAIRDPGLGQIAEEVALGSSPSWDYAHDTRYYDRLPVLPPPMGLVLPQSSGMSEWLRNPVQAARNGAPSSPLAHCR